MSTQDWKQIVIRKPQTGGKCIINPTTNKVECYSDVIPVKQNTKQMGAIIKKTRTEMKMTQKELAQSINVRENVINDIENEKGVYNAEIINKIANKLKIKIHR